MAVTRGRGALLASLSPGSEERGRDQGSNIYLFQGIPLWLNFRKILSLNVLPPPNSSIGNKHISLWRILHIQITTIGDEDAKVRGLGSWRKQNEINDTETVVSAHLNKAGHNPSSWEWALPPFLVHDSLCWLPFPLSSLLGMHWSPLIWQYEDRDSQVTLWVVHGRVILPWWTLHWTEEVVRRHYRLWTNSRMFRDGVGRHFHTFHK